MKETFWTLGQYDVGAIIEAPDEMTMTALGLSLGALALEAIPGLGVLPFWLPVVGAIAVLGTPRPNFERH